MRTLAAFSTVVVALVPSTVVYGAGQNVVYVPADKAQDAIVKGNLTIVPQDPALGFRVSTGLKTAPSGEIEQHAGHTHIFFILDGEGTLVIGGTIVNVKELRPGELTGTDIQGGVAYQMKKGDVITVPVDLPHWWKDVPNHVSYYAVHVYTKR